MELESVLVTGGAGFIGSHLCDALAATGRYNVLAMDDLSGTECKWENVKSKFVGWSTLACENYEQVLDSYDEGDIDTLVHCAANAREGASQFQPHAVTQANLHAYMSVLSAAIQRKVKRVVLLSSMSVYGHQQTPFHEELPLAPADVYAVNKAAMETTTAILSDVHGFKYVILRPHNVFGERQALHDKFRNVAAIFMNRIMREEPLFIYGDGLQERAFSYIEDTIPAMVAAIENVESLHGQTFNVGGMQEITVNELAKKVKAAMGVDESYTTEYHIDRPCEVKRAFSTYTKSVDQLGYREEYGWEQGLTRMAKWALERGMSAWHTERPLEIINAKTPKPWLVK